MPSALDVTPARFVLSGGVMRSTTRFRRLAAIPSLAALVCTLACEPSSTELQEWTPADHDNQSTPQAGQVDTTQPRPGMPDLEKQGVTDVVLAAWKNNCVRCHGIIGRGDGPDGRVFNPPDLTNPRWQRVAIDSEIAHTIRKGRGKMPGFAQLPDSTVEGLVRLVRMLSAEKAQAGDDQGSRPR